MKDNNIKTRLAHRTKIIMGQLRAIEKSIEEDQYYLDIINQSHAIQKSLSSLNKLLLEDHLRTDLKGQLASRRKNQSEKAIKELIKLFDLNASNR